MADYSLYEGDNIVVNTDTIINDFYYYGGKIDVPPSINFSINGDFIFCPTTDEDPVGLLYKALVARIEIESGKNGLLFGFQVYDLYPSNRALFFPCVVFGKIERESPIAEPLFGGEYMEGETIVCDLAFKSTEARTIGGVIVERGDLANHYLTNVREILNSIIFRSDAVNVGDFKERSSIQEPQEDNQTLWGFSMEISLDFKSPTNLI